MPNQTIEPFNVAVLLFQDVELQDFAGPTEVFVKAAGYAGVPCTIYPYTIEKSWFTNTKIICTEGKTVVIKARNINSIPKPDVLIIPGANPNLIDQLVQDKAFLQKAILDLKSTPIIMSVCTGAFLLAASGLLDDLKATTHYMSADKLAEDYKAQNVDVIKNVRYVDQGHIITTSGITSGIDGALHLLERIAGETIAKNIANLMQYEPHLHEIWPKS